MAAGNSIGCAFSGEELVPLWWTSGRSLRFKTSGSETPEGVTTRTSRSPGAASAATVILAVSALSSLIFKSVAAMPLWWESGSLLNKKPLALVRFSPEKEISTVVPCCTHCGERELSLGTGWAWVWNRANNGISNRAARRSLAWRMVLVLLLVAIVVDEVSFMLPNGTVEHEDLVRLLLTMTELF